MQHSPGLGWATLQQAAVSGACSESRVLVTSFFLLPGLMVGLLLGLWPFAQAQARMPNGAIQSFKIQHAGAPLVGVLLPPGCKLRPEAHRPLLRVADRAHGSAWAVINGGYFNHADGQSVSWATSEGRILADPTRNQKLIQNPALAPHLNTLLHGRTAWMAFAGQPEGWAMGHPGLKGPQGQSPIALLQAGPRLLPALGLEAEAFLRPGPQGQRVDAIQSRAKVPRSALGLRADGTMIWVVAQSPGLRLKELAAAMAILGAKEAMALDGGSSSALAWRESKGWKLASGPRSGAAAVNTLLVAWPPP